MATPSAPQAPVQAPPYAPPPQAAAPPAVPTRDRPLGVTILTVLWVLGGLAFLLAGLTVATVGSLASAAFIPIPGLAALGAAFAAIIGVLLMGLGLVLVVVASGMWKGSPWAWTVSLILVLLGLVFSLLSLLSLDFSSLVSIAIDVFLIWYLTREGVQRWFGKVGSWPAPQVDSLLGKLNTAK